MCQPSQLFTAAIGAATVTTGNANLDGSGPTVLFLTAAQNTVLQTLTIKAQQSNDQGMIRIFVKLSGDATKYLWREIPVPANVQSATVPAYQTTVRAAITLKAGDELYASTQNSETWNIIADATSWENCACPEIAP